MFEILKDKRGSLLPIEFNTLPFSPVRVFSVFDVPINTIRGNHAHLKTVQLLICLRGIVDVGLDDGTEEVVHRLSPGKSILIDKMIWDWQKFITGSDEILVFCSTPYDKFDYINDKKKFYDFLKTK